MEKPEDLLEQRRFLSSRQFQRVDEGVIVHDATPVTASRLKVRYEDLGEDVQWFRQGSKLLFALAAISALVLVVLLAALPFDRGHGLALGAAAASTLLTAAGFLLSRRSFVEVVGGNITLSFYADSPDEEEVSGFVERLLEERARYLQAQQAGDGYYDDDLTRIQALRDHGYLTDDEFIVLSQLYDDVDLTSDPESGGGESVH